jgi:hypothetical protein
MEKAASWSVQLAAFWFGGSVSISIVEIRGGKVRQVFLADFAFGLLGLAGFAGVWGVDRVGGCGREAGLSTSLWSR